MTFIKKTLGKLFGDRQEKNIKELKPYVGQINEIFDSLSSLSTTELKEKTTEFRRRLVAGSSTDDLMCEAFAVVKEACRRCLGTSWTVTGEDTEWNMVPFDVQLIGAVVLHQGRIAEMATGEGKTLVAVMPMYLNAIAINPEWQELAEAKWGDDQSKWEFEPIDDIPVSRGAHLVTVNDYLARRDADWMSGIYEYLGLTIGCIQMEMTPAERREQYNKDITYGTNNQFGFDYLRDNMATTLQQRVQREYHFVIVDEVDSVLIDEARTPLIISGPVAQSKNRYKDFRNDVNRLVRKQTNIVSSLVSKAEEEWEKGNIEDATLLYLKARRGAPKHKKLTRILQDPDKLHEIKRMEGILLRDKSVHTLEEGLLFSLDEKDRSVSLSGDGRKMLSPNDPDFFLLDDIGDVISTIRMKEITEAEKLRLEEKAYSEHSHRAESLHNIDQLLKAFQLFEKDVEYVVQDGKVMIVDQFTGRLMPGRRFSDGLHEALEAKENVEIRNETQTLATITIQNYFRMYEKLSGMTGTAETEADEFEDIYGLDVVVVPTNVQINRDDQNDRVYKSRRGKYNAIISEVARLHALGQPVLVGTVNVDVSELLSRLLKTQKIPHSVLNAKQHQSEADIIKRAGQRGAITIATNMAGRGTDIKLAREIIEITERDGSKIPGGLFVIGTERHESRRIDRQLRGRSGRQGDPGTSRFYLSLEDDLFRLFASEKMIDFLKRSTGEGDDVPIEHPMLTKAIEKAQRRVEEHNYGIRKHLLEYDDVVNKQREVIYSRRLQALTGEGLSAEVDDMILGVARSVVSDSFPENTTPDEWNTEDAQTLLSELAGTPIHFSDIADITSSPDDALDIAAGKVLDFYRMKREKLGDEMIREFEKRVIIISIDSLWRQHLYAIDHLKSGVGLRAYAQRDPLVEFKKEAFGLFEILLDNIDGKSVRQILGLWPRRTGSGMPESKQVSGTAFQPGLASPPLNRQNSNMDTVAGSGKVHTIKRTGDKVGRNDPCPCGSGKKYKKCCGAG